MYWSICFRLAAYSPNWYVSHDLKTKLRSCFLCSFSEHSLESKKKTKLNFCQIFPDSKVCSNLWHLGFATIQCHKWTFNCCLKFDISGLNWTLSIIICLFETNIFIRDLTLRHASRTHLIIFFVTKLWKLNVSEIT